METLEKVTFEVPTREQVSENNQAIFDQMQNHLVQFLIYMQLLH